MDRRNFLKIAAGLHGDVVARIEDHLKTARTESAHWSPEKAQKWYDLWQKNQQ